MTNTWVAARCTWLPDVQRKGAAALRSMRSGYCMNQQLLGRVSNVQEFCFVFNIASGTSSSSTSTREAFSGTTALYSIYNTIGRSIASIYNPVYLRRLYMSAIDLPTVLPENAY